MRMREISIDCRDGSACRNGQVVVEIPFDTPNDVADRMVSRDGNEDTVYLTPTELQESGMLSNVYDELDEEGGFEIIPIGSTVCHNCGRDGD